MKNIGGSSDSNAIFDNNEINSSTYKTNSG